VHGSTASANTSVKNHSEIWMVCDIDGANYPTTDSPTFGINGFKPPHSNGRNYGFFDGHVEYRRMDNLPPNP